MDSSPHHQVYNPISTKGKLHRYRLILQLDSICKPEKLSSSMLSLPDTRPSFSIVA